MAITITKPEINVREKLKELDFETVPFQKMPSGSVIQVVQEIYNTREVFQSSGIVDTSISAAITPHSSTNNILIFIEAAVSVESPTNNFRNLFIKRDSQVITNSAEIRYDFMADNGGDALRTSLSFGDSPNTTNPVTYKLAVNAVGNAISIGGRVINTGANQHSVITLMEIAG